MSALATALVRDPFAVVMGQKKGVSPHLRQRTPKLTVGKPVPFLRPPHSLWIYGDVKWGQVVIDGDIDGAGHYDEADGPFFISYRRTFTLPINVQWNGETWSVKVRKGLEDGALRLYVGPHREEDPTSMRRTGIAFPAQRYSPRHHSYATPEECYQASGLPSEEVQYLTGVGSRAGSLTHILRVDELIHKDIKVLTHRDWKKSWVR